MWWCRWVIRTTRNVLMCTSVSQALAQQSIKIVKVLYVDVVLSSVLQLQLNTVLVHSYAFNLYRCARAVRCAAPPRATPTTLNTMRPLCCWCVNFFKVRLQMPCSAMTIAGFAVHLSPPCFKFVKQHIQNTMHTARWTTPASRSCGWWCGTMTTAGVTKCWAWLRCRWTRCVTG